MNQWLWLLGLCLLLLMLFLLALLKPVFRKPTTKSILPNQAPTVSLEHSQKLMTMLSPSLPKYLLESRSNRLLIGQNGKQIAIITIDDHAVIHERLMADVLILNIPTHFGTKQVAEVLKKVRQHAIEPRFLD